MCKDRTVFIHMSRRWEYIVDLLQTTNLSSFFLSELQSGADDLCAKILLAVNLLSNLITQHKPEKPGKHCQLQIKPLKTQKTETFQQLMQANRL